MRYFVDRDESFSGIFVSGHSGFESLFLTGVVVLMSYLIKLPLFVCRGASLNISVLFLQV